MLVSLTGPSGVGKTTLLRGLLRALPEARPLMSYTTRARRPSDEPGEYAYVSDEEFEAMKERGEFLWVAYPHGKKYATRKADVDAALAGGLCLPILVIESVQQLHTYARAQGRTKTLMSLYLNINDEARLRARFAARGDLGPQEVGARIAECRSWEAQARRSGVPFVFLQAAQAPEAVLEQALAAVRGSTALP